MNNSNEFLVKMNSEKPEKDLFKNDHRVLIIGSSNSGKSYFVKNYYLKKFMEYSTPNSILLCTKNERNVESYKFYLKSLGFNISDLVVIHELSDFEEIYSKLNKYQEENISGYDREGHPIYDSRFLIIFDDFLDKGIVNNQSIINAFTNGRHHRITTLFISQVNNRFVDSLMKTNSDYIFIFNTNNRKTKDLLSYEFILNCISKKYPNVGYENLKSFAKKIYFKFIVEITFGWILINQTNCDLYLPPKYAKYGPKTYPKLD